jgi:hypothetical protein
VGRKRSGKADLPRAHDLLPILVEYDEVAAKFCRELPDGTKGTDDDLRLVEVKEKLKSALGDRPAVAVPFPGAKKDRKIYFRQQDGRTSWNTDDLAQRYEKIRADLRQELVISEDRVIAMEVLRDQVADAILYGEKVEAREHARSMASIGRAVLDRRDEFDTLFPPAESFRRQGVPFRALRIY